jgi:hypothetical protein
MATAEDNDMNKPETNPVTRFYRNDKKGWRPAINAMCAFCVGCTSELQGEKFKEHIEPGFRVTIAQCAVFACPIHHLRPYQEK